MQTELSVRSRDCCSKVRAFVPSCRTVLPLLLTLKTFNLCPPIHCTYTAVDLLTKLTSEALAEGTTLSDADTISDNNYIFMSLTVTAPHFTADMWSSVRDKLLRMVQLSNVRGVGQLSEIAQVCLLIFSVSAAG